MTTPLIGVKTRWTHVPRISLLLASGCDHVSLPHETLSTDTYIRIDIFDLSADMHASTRNSNQCIQTQNLRMRKRKRSSGEYCSTQIRSSIFSRLDLIVAMSTCHTTYTFYKDVIDHQLNHRQPVSFFLSPEGYLTWMAWSRRRSSFHHICTFCSSCRESSEDAHCFMEHNLVFVLFNVSM